MGDVIYLVPVLPPHDQLEVARLLLLPLKTDFVTKEQPRISLAPHSRCSALSRCRALIASLGKWLSAHV